jgi:transcriptional regulator with XRE-family HTH domain
MGPMTYQKALLDLAQALRGARAAAGLTQEALAARLAEATGERLWTQDRVSKIEAARHARPLPERDVAAWAKACRARRKPLLDLRAAAAEKLATRDEARRGDGGGVALHADLGAVEAEAREVDWLVTGNVPGILQTPSYARALLLGPAGNRPWRPAPDPVAVEQILAGRALRAVIMREAGKVGVIMPEAALGVLLVPADVARGQLEWLAHVARVMPGVRLGVIPAGTVVAAPLLSGWKLLRFAERTAVSIELATDDAWISDPEQVSSYEAWWDQAAGDAVYGEDAAVLFEAAAGRLAG